MSAHRSGSHQKKLDELFSIYIKSDMIGRKDNKINLKISTNSSKPQQRATTAKRQRTVEAKPPASMPPPDTQASSTSQRAKSHRSAVNLTMSSRETRVTFSTDKDLDREVEHIFHPIRDADDIPESAEDIPPISPTPRRCMTSPRNSPRESAKQSPTFMEGHKADQNKTPSPKETYARILATLKRIEEEEDRLNLIPKTVETETSIDKMLNRLHSLDLDQGSRSSTPSQGLGSPKSAKKLAASSSALPPVKEPSGLVSSVSTPRLPPLQSPGYNGNGQPLKGHDHLEMRPGSIQSSRSLEQEPVRLPKEENIQPRIGPTPSPRWEPTAEKAKNIFSFLDEVEKCDREILFNLKTERSPRSGAGDGISGGHLGSTYTPRSSDFPTQTMDSLIRRGSVELAREIILLQRKIEEYQHNIKVMEETLINQRELNMRHIKNSERDLKKRLKLQQEEFELALSRHQAFVDQLISEKRLLQEKCEKLLRESKEIEMKHQDQIRSLQEKHLEELKRLRKLQDSSEKNRRIKWMGSKTQEIRETTIKNLEPELQRVIQRHQQEMTEMRAWHANELQEMEERTARKLTKQALEIREKMLQEKEEAMKRERELIERRHEAELEHLKEEIEAQKRRYVQELHEERERFEVEQAKVKEVIQESIKKVEIKAEVELETAREQYEAKIMALERKHETELKAVNSVHEAERQSAVANFNKKLEQAVAEKELLLVQAFKAEKDADLEERERRLRHDFEKQWKEQEEAFESRLKRLQEKFQSEIHEFEETEKELKAKLSQVKTELIGKEEEIFTLKTTLNLKEKQISELADNNMKMLEERANLTAVIRREFASQIEALEQDCMAVKSSVVELKTKQKMEQEHHQLELEKVRQEKDNELEHVGQRVVQAMARKEETIVELQKQLEKTSFRVSHLEELIEQQRKEFVHSMTVTKGPKKFK